MKTNTHTPGPWHVERHTRTELSETGPGNTYIAMGYPIFLIVHEGDDPKFRTCVAELQASTEAGANASLIAAAPDLLETLEALLRADEMPPDDLQIEIALNAMKMARQAIAKAKGEA